VFQGIREDQRFCGGEETSVKALFFRLRSLCVIRTDAGRKELRTVMKQTRIGQLMLLGLGLVFLGCGEGGEGPIVPPPPAPAEYADKHMPAGWWADAAKMEEGRKLFIGETNPDVNCASCHGKDGKPVKAGARDFRNGERMKLYSDSVWFWRISEGVPNTKMKAWKSKLSDEDRWKLLLFERNFGLPGKAWDADKKQWADAGTIAVASAAGVK
jgi:mono/diheme cytochrome c family protein